MASTNRTGRVSAIDYEAGTYEVTYFDRGKSVTRQINAMSNGEYKMPCVGQVVSVAHNSNGTAAGTTRWIVDVQTSLVHTAIASPKLTTKPSSSGTTSCHSPSRPTTCRPGTGSAMSTVRIP